jgi:hypothetical protein
LHLIVEVKIEMSITMHFYTGRYKTRCSTRIKWQFPIFFIYKLSAQKLFMENVNNCYLQMRLLIFNNYNLKNFKNVMKTEFESLNKWFKANRLSLAGQSKAWVCGRSLAGIVVSNPTRDMEDCGECCILSGGGLSAGLNIIQRSTTHCGVPECDREASIMRGPGSTIAVCAMCVNSKIFARFSLLQLPSNGSFYADSRPPIILRQSEGA